MNAMTEMKTTLSPNNSTLPVIIIGAGPVGLAAAAHLILRGIPVRVLEAGNAAAAHVRTWGHIRLFSPWSYNLDKAARVLLEQTGWKEPPQNVHPTGNELYERYLKPLAATPELSTIIQTGAKVVAVSRQGFDKMKSAGREIAPFAVVVRTADGTERQELGRAVIDASGTWSTPNPIGNNGLPVPGEVEAAQFITYGAPDVADADRSKYAGKRVLVIGAGHSAANVLLDLARLKTTAPATEIVWAVRGGSLARLFGGGENDKLAARGELGRSLESLVKTGVIDLRMQSTVTMVATGAAAQVTLQQPNGTTEVVTVDHIIVSTGQRPNTDMLREIRLDLDPATESPRILAPLIDPNVHSCGTVRPHGHRELAQPDTGFYIAGIKSYGRAPTFLMATGYEQVRSIVAAIAGDLAAADDVQLDLPETGVCSTNLVTEGAGCSTSSCSTPEPAAASCGSSKASETKDCGTTCCDTPEPVPAATACCSRANDTAAAAGQPVRPIAQKACC